MKKTMLLLLAAIPVALTSCLGDNEVSNTMQLNADMVQIKSSADGTSTLNTASYFFEMELTNSPYINIRISDKDISPVAFNLQGLPMAVSNSLGYTFHAEAITPVDANGTPLSGIEITNLYGQYTGNTLDMRYTLNGSTNITAFPDGVVYNYNSVTTTAPGSEPYDYDESRASVVYRINADSALVDLALANIKFVDEMPGIQSMVFPSITVTPSITGTFLELKADSIIPEISNTPYPKYKITDFSATMNPSFNPTSYFQNENVTGTFKCMGMEVSFKAQMFAPAN